MKLTVTDRVEQGTKRGVMLFKPGLEYAVEKQGEEFLVTHEPRTEIRRVENEDGQMVRQPVSVTQTRVDAALLEKLGKVAKVED